MAKIADREQLLEAYNDVRNDQSEVNWCCLKYDDSNQIVLESTGENFDEIKAKFENDQRVYVYLRLVTGDEMSRRSKFALVTWIGPQVSAMKKAKASTDKASVKGIFVNFAIETLVEDLHDFSEDKIRELLNKAGGANYGTGR